MLVPLILYNKKILPTPCFYISAYLEKHDDIYRKQLLAISQEKDWDGWISFFLKAMVDRLRENNEEVNSIIKLNTDIRRDVPKILNSQYSPQVIIDVLSPLFNKNQFCKAPGIPKREPEVDIPKIGGE